MSKVSQHSLIFLGSILLLRLISMILVPLTDTTEARYGEIARKMLETGDWVTLWHDYGVPFWAKPPLSTWVSALSMSAWGVSEWSARLPALILGVFVLLLVWRLARTYFDQAQCWLIMIILASSSLFYLVSGTVMTDMPLLFSVTLTLTAFWLTLHSGSRLWAYGFFVAIALDLLVKGPAALVLALLPIISWLAWSKQWATAWKIFPWWSGMGLTLLIGLPWYVWAELKTPGFLNYFIIGEHFSRFLEPAWQGDRYGHAHNEPLGSIWPFLLVGAFPWIWIVIPLALKGWRQSWPLTSISSGLSDFEKYLWCWFLAPLVFFSFAHNIILTYALTALPGLAMLLGKTLVQTALEKNQIRRWVFITASTTPLLLAGATALSLYAPEISKRSAKPVTELFQQQKTTPESRLVYIGERLYSMDFYNAGKAIRLYDTQLALTTKHQHEWFLALKNSQDEQLTLEQRQSLHAAGVTRTYHLYRIMQTGVQP